MAGRRVTADDVIKALEKRLPLELKHIISDNGKQFIAEVFQKLCDSRDIVHVRISPHRPVTNGIAERFVRRLKEMLAEREWISEEELKMVLNEVINEYNDAPHQGLNGLSPNEFERGLMCVSSNCNSINNIKKRKEREEFKLFFVCFGSLSGCSRISFSELELDYCCSAIDFDFVVRLLRLLLNALRCRRRWHTLDHPYCNQ